MDALDQKSMQSSADVTDHLKDSLDLISSHTKQAGTSVVVDQDLEGPPAEIQEAVRNGASVTLHQDLEGGGTSVVVDQDLEGPPAEIQEAVRSGASVTFHQDLEGGGTSVVVDQDLEGPPAEIQEAVRSGASVTLHQDLEGGGTSVVVDQDLEGPPTLISSEMQESGTSVATDLEGPFPSFSPDMAAEVLSYLRARGLSDEITISIANGFLQQILTSGFVLNFTLLVC